MASKGGQTMRHSRLLSLPNDVTQANGRYGGPQSFNDNRIREALKRLHLQLRLCFPNSVLDHSRTFQTYFSTNLSNLRFRERKKPQIHRQIHRYTDTSILEVPSL